MTNEESSLSDERKLGLEKYELRLNPIRVSVELDGTESGIELAKEKFRTELEPLLRIVHVNELPYDIVEILEDGSERTMIADIDIKDETRTHPTFAQLITAVNIYSEYWDFIPEKERAELDERLKAVDC